MTTLVTPVSDRQDNMDLHINYLSSNVFLGDTSFVALAKCAVWAEEATPAAPPPTASCMTRLAHWQESISVSSRHYFDAHQGLYKKHHRPPVASERQPKDSFKLR